MLLVVAYTRKSTVMNFLRFDESVSTQKVGWMGEWRQVENHGRNKYNKRRIINIVQSQNRDEKHRTEFDLILEFFSGRIFQKSISVFTFSTSARVVRCWSIKTPGRSASSRPSNLRYWFYRFVMAEIFVGGTLHCHCQDSRR